MKGRNDEHVSLQKQGPHPVAVGTSASLGSSELLSGSFYSSWSESLHHL